MCSHTRNPASTRRPQPDLDCTGTARRSDVAGKSWLCVVASHDLQQLTVFVAVRRCLKPEVLSPETDPDQPDLEKLIEVSRPSWGASS